MPDLNRLFRSNRALLAILLVLSFSAYLNTYQNQFTYDDSEIILRDHRLRSAASIPSLFTEGYWSVPMANIYRPLTLLTIAGNYQLSKESPWSYHLVNQLLHCLNTALLFLFLGNYLGERHGDRPVCPAV